jgi:hypothetical protein
MGLPGPAAGALTGFAGAQLIRGPDMPPPAEVAARPDAQELAQPLVVGVGILLGSGEGGSDLRRRLFE